MAIRSRSSPPTSSASAPKPRTSTTCWRPFARWRCAPPCPGATWLDNRMFAPDQERGYSLFPLSEEEDHSLAVFAVSWLPDRGTPLHDHGTWAVVAAVLGPEWNTFWRRQDDGTRPGYAKLAQTGAKMFLPGEVLAIPTGMIHQVWNQTSAVTISLHIYGRHIDHTERSQFDAKNDTVQPFVARIAS